MRVILLLILLINRLVLIYFDVFIYTYTLLLCMFAGEPKRFGTQIPPLTKTIKDILERYPDGGQILKVSDS